jgi:hypothetical protein
MAGSPIRLTFLHVLEAAYEACDHQNPANDIQIRYAMSPPDEVALLKRLTRAQVDWFSVVQASQPLQRA